MWIGLDPLKHCKAFLFYIMEYRNYLGYKIYDDGSVFNKKGIKLIPQKNGNSYYYEIYINSVKKIINTSKLVLYSFEIYPNFLHRKVKRLDGNKKNDSLSNLRWY